MTIVKWIIFIVAMIILVCSILLIISDGKQIETVENDETYSEWSIEKLPTENDEGLISRETKAGKKDNFHLPILSSDKYIKVMLDEPTCEKSGNTKYTICAKNKYYSFIIKTNPLGHDFSDVTYTWGEDNLSCVAKRVCLRNKDHIEEDIGMISTIKIDRATCSHNGSTTYTATFKSDWAKEQSKVIYNLDIDKSNHKYEVEYVWNEDYSSCTAKKVCKLNKEHNEDVVSSSVMSDVTLAPTFLNKGNIRFYPIFSDENLGIYKDVEIPVLDDISYTLDKTIVESSAYNMGIGTYNYTYKGIDYKFNSDIKKYDLKYYFDKNYYSALGNYLTVDGYDTTYINDEIDKLKIDDLKVYNNKELKILIDDYNKNNEVKLKYNVVNNNQKFSETICNVILNVDFDVQVLAYIKEGTLNLFTYNGILITEDPTTLKTNIELALNGINYKGIVNHITKDALLVLDELSSNYVSFELLDEITKTDGTVLSKDKKYLIDVEGFSSTYTVLDGVEFVLNQALENETNKAIIPSSVRYIGNYGLGYLDSITFNENSQLEYIGECAFIDCKSIDLNGLDKLKYIGKRALYNATLGETYLRSVEYIADEAFSCSNSDSNKLKLHLPKILNTIGKNVFINRMNLDIYVKEKVNENFNKDWNNVSLDGVQKANIIIE